MATNAAMETAIAEVDPAVVRERDEEYFRLRIRTLGQGIRDLLEGRAVWAASDDESILHDSAVWLACEAMIPDWEAGMIPGDLRPLFPVVTDELLPSWKRYRDMVEESGSVDACPPREFWAAIEKIEGFFEEQADVRKPRKMETIKELLKQRVGYRQIAKIFGWIRKDGSPDETMVREEVETPGTHIQSGYVSPTEQLEREKEQSKREASARIRELLDIKLKRMEEEVPESIEDLVKQGLDAKQIGTVYGMTAKAVIDECEKQGIDPPAEAINVFAERSPYDPDLGDATKRILDAMDDSSKKLALPADEPSVVPTELTSPVKTDRQPDGPRTIEQQIIDLYLEGKSAKIIAEQISTEGVKIHGNKVHGIIKRYEDHPEDFERFTHS